MEPIRGRLDAYLISFMSGPLKVSLIFTLMVVLFATDITASTVTDQWRTRSIILITFKMMLINHLQVNFDQIGSESDSTRMVPKGAVVVPEGMVPGA